MPQRLSAVEAGLWAADPQPVLGAVHVLDPPAPDVPDLDGPHLDHDALLALVAERLDYVPRYRSRVREVPGGLARPVWVEVTDVDLRHHVRRAVLSPPGDPEQLHAFAATVLGQDLDRSRPPWELYLVTGLADGRTALVTKTSPCLVDGGDTVDLVQVLLDGEPAPVPPPLEEAAERAALPEPSAAELVLGALWELTDPARAARAARALGASGLALAAAVGRAGLAAGQPVPEPVADVAPHPRPYATWSLPLLEVATRHGHPGHDVLLALVCGAVRGWLVESGAELARPDVVSALVPMAVAEQRGAVGALGLEVVPTRQRLPVGEPSPLVRLHLVGYGTRAHRERRRPVPAGTLAAIPGFSPPTLHALAARAVAADGSPGRRPPDLTLSHAPGPQLPLYAGSARLAHTVSVLPPTGRLFDLAVTSYAGTVSIGVTAGPVAVEVGAQSLVGHLDAAWQELRDPALRVPLDARG